MNQAIDRLNLMQRKGRILEPYVANEFSTGVEITECEFWTADMKSIALEFDNFMMHRGHLVIN